MRLMCVMYVEISFDVPNSMESRMKGTKKNQIDRFYRRMQIETPIKTHHFRWEFIMVCDLRNFYWSENGIHAIEINKIVIIKLADRLK